MLAFWLVLILPAGARAQEVRLLKKTPKAPVESIELNGPGQFSAPITDRERNGFLLWRCVTGKKSRELVESLYYLNIRSDQGAAKIRTRATIPAQAYFSLNQGHGAREIHGAVPDGQGGVFYLWSSSVVRIGADGKKLWPSLRGRPDKKGRLWKYPGVLYTTNARDRIRSASIDTDGKGHALVFWESDSGFRMQKIAPWGERQWGERGISLSQRRRELGRGVGDGKGGAIVLLARFDFPRSVRVKFISPAGKVVREIGAALNLDRDRVLARSDGAGGMLLLYTEPVVRGGTRLGGEVHLARFHPDYGRVYDRALSPLLPEDLEPGGLFLNAGAGGTALASWRHLARRRKVPTALLPGIPPGPEEVEDRIVRRLVRLSPSGRMFWEPARIELPSRAGYRRNDEGGVSLLDHGDDTLVLFESLDPARRRLVLYFQKIDASGKFVFPDAGRSIAEGRRNSLHPFLWKLRGEPAAVYYRKKSVGKHDVLYEPILEWLDAK